MIPIVFLEMRKPNQAEQFHLENYIHDVIHYENSNLLEIWTDSLIAEKRAVALREFDWENRAPIYRQVNILRDIKIFLTKGKP